MPNNPRRKSKKYKIWISVIFGILSIFLLLNGIFYHIIGPNKIEPLKSDFTNINSEAPLSVRLVDVQDLKLEYYTKGPRRIIIYYNHFLVKINGRKVIIETNDPKNISVDKIINITKKVSPTAAENELSVRDKAFTLVTKDSLKLTQLEKETIPILSHYTDGSKGFAQAIMYFYFIVSTGISIYYYTNYRKDFLEIAREQMVINYQKEE